MRYENTKRVGWYENWCECNENKMKATQAKFVEKYGKSMTTSVCSSLAMNLVSKDVLHNDTIVHS